MLPFRVTQIEHHRALKQKAAPQFFPKICRLEFPLVSTQPARRLSEGLALNGLSEGYDWAPYTSNQPARRLLGGLAVTPPRADEIFGVQKCISTRFCSIYRMRRNLLKTNDRAVSTRGHNHIPRSHEFQPISTKVVIEEP